MVDLSSASRAGGMTLRKVVSVCRDIAGGEVIPLQLEPGIYLAAGAKDPYDIRIRAYQPSKLTYFRFVDYSIFYLFHVFYYDDEFFDPPEIINIASGARFACLGVYRVVEQ